MSEQLTEPILPKQRHNRSWIGALVLILLLAVVLVGVYAVTLAPGHYAQAQAERVNGDEVVSIGDPVVATVTPEKEWSVRPLVTPLFGELELLKNPAVIFGVSPGAQIGSPDGMLTVTFEPLGAANPDSVLEADGQPGAPVQEEVLSTGLLLSHVNTGTSENSAPDGLTAIVASADGRGQGLDATPLLVRVTLRDDAQHDLDDYRPALSALFESIELAGHTG